MSIVDEFRAQAVHCHALGSPFMDRLMRLLADHWPLDTTIAKRFAEWPGDLGPGGASLPLRLAGGLHALVIRGLDEGLIAAYPPNDVPDAQLIKAVAGAMTRHETFLNTWIENAPQTNEVGRSAALIAVADWLGHRIGLPLQLSELGASAGLNLNFDRFGLRVGGQTFGATDPVLMLDPEWKGPGLNGTMPPVAGRAGVDLNPLDPRDDGDALRLLAYLWPDQPARLQRTRAALAQPAAEVAKDDAIEWLQDRLATPMPGNLHLIYHTVAWQYFPQSAQTRGKTLIEQAGEAATDASPLAWFGMENDGQSPGAALTLRLWPGDLYFTLGRACFHGRWVHWSPEA